MKQRLCLEFGVPLTAGVLEASVSQGLQEEADEDVLLFVLDSVDRRIWKSDRVLVRKENRELILFDKDGYPTATGSAARNLRFVEDLPATLACQLTELPAERALVEHFSCRLKTRHLILLNDDVKTLVRLQLHHLCGSANTERYFLDATALRGYEKDLAQLEKELEALNPQPFRTLTMRNLLLAAGMNPRPINTKPKFQLTPEQPAEPAVVGMCLELLRLARCQEDGIIADIDTEFVHQYRVNLRKARSLVSLFKKSLARERYQLVRGEMKSMARQTNLLRDLDVFLLSRQNYLEMLPEQQRRGLEALFLRIARRRRTLLKKVANTLQSHHYRQTATKLEMTLLQPPKLTARQAATPIKALVCRKILKQYRLIQRDGARIDANTADEHIHELRIEAKKLRYLLELFAGLFPAGEIRKLIRELKLLQDNLGNFNDYSSQRDFLQQLVSAPGTTPPQRDAINGLTAILYSRQCRERDLVVSLIGDFSAPPVANLFQQLFNPLSVKGCGS